MAKDQWELVPEAHPKYGSSWVEDVADEVLEDPSVREAFLSEVLPPAVKGRRDFRASLAELVKGHRNPITGEISDGLRYLMVWPPGERLNVGDIGTFPDGGSFRIEAQVSAFGVRLDVDIELVPDLTYMSSGVQGIQVDDARMRFTFPKPGDKYFRARGASTQKMSSPTGLAQAIAELQARGVWQRGWSVVTEVVEADELLIFVAGEANASVELQAAAPQSNAESIIAERPTVSSQVGMATTVLAGPNVPTLYRVVRLRSSWFARAGGPADPALVTSSAQL